MFKMIIHLLKTDETVKYFGQLFKVLLLHWYGRIIRSFVKYQKQHYILYQNNTNLSKIYFFVCGN